MSGPGLQAKIVGGCVTAVLMGVLGWVGTSVSRTADELAMVRTDIAVIKADAASERRERRAALASYATAIEVAELRAHWASLRERMTAFEARMHAPHP